MHRTNRWLFVVMLMILAALPLAACSGTSESATEKPQPAYIQPIEGAAGVNRVVLTQKAAERLDIQTALVRQEEVNGEPRIVIPYSAVLYDLTGATWVYTSPEPLVFVREPVTVDFIEGDMAVLFDGPAVNTEIALVGVAELYGIDTGVGK